MSAESLNPPVFSFLLSFLSHFGGWSVQLCEGFIAHWINAPHLLTWADISTHQVVLDESIECSLNLCH